MSAPAGGDRLLTRRELEIYRRAYEDGYGRGALDVDQERDEAWRQAAEPAAQCGPTHAELETRRWGPGGREHFADPRPGDFQGQQASPETEREAG